MEGTPVLRALNYVVQNYDVERFVLRRLISTRYGPTSPRAPQPPLYIHTL